MTKIKICGLSRQEDIDFVNEALPDYIGFVFAKSKRLITEETAMKLKWKLHPFIQTVGVFVNEDNNRIIRLCREKVIDIVQLHGDESREDILKLKAQIKNPVIKAIRTENSQDISRAAELSCDYLLFDAFKEGQHGGGGETFDWTLIKDVNTPFFLAGGLNSGNVVKAISMVKPYAVDISSGVETDGVKDKSKIIDFITKVRSV